MSGPHLTCISAAEVTFRMQQFGRGFAPGHVAEWSSWPGISPMRAEHINPFIAAVKNAFRTMLDCERGGATWP